MIDNRKVNSTRQKGIERVVQKKNEPGRVGQGGRMHNKGSAHWSRPKDRVTTPRGA